MPKTTTTNRLNAIKPKINFCVLLNFSSFIHKTLSQAYILKKAVLLTSLHQYVDSFHTPSLRLQSLGGPL